jgi:crotonobetainyl-CoA:carnitine CoA-transferase CaiB-like acyl-CoA transferase
MGAEVIKIDSPDDPARGLRGTGREQRIRRQGLDRNKKSIVLDLKQRSSQEVFHKLAATADVVLEGFRPGIATRLGVDYDTIHAINPRIVYCSLSGYGQTGPYKDLPGHDINYMAMSGALDMIGTRGGPPVEPLNLIADLSSASLHGVIGVLTALMARQQTGKGQQVDVSYTYGVVSLLSGASALYSHILDGVGAKRGEPNTAGSYAYYGVYETKDGKWFTIGCIEHHFWENFCRVIGREDLLPYRQAPNHQEDAPTGEWDWVRQELEKVFLTRTRDEWWELLKDHNICIGKVYTIDEALKDIQMQHRGMVVEIEDPELGKIRQIGVPIGYSETPGRTQFTPAPRVGENTDELLEALGYAQGEISAMRGDRAVA